jgi:hypothetical protein
VNQGSEVAMSPAEFLADVEVAVTYRDVVLPRSREGDDDRDELIAAAGAPPADDRPSGQAG